MSKIKDALIEEQMQDLIDADFEYNRTHPIPDFFTTNWENKARFNRGLTPNGRQEEREDFALERNNPRL